ncbi:MAG: 10 kDa chaperonin [Candidatus Parcubacteria bacterium]|nr:MAG: 10 kDa chaperonin [Candidatus Parcubacteria bacterium]
MKIKPLSDYILVEPIKQEEVTKGGIIIPETAREERAVKGKIIATGPGRLNDKGERISLSVKEGQMVLFKKYSPDEIKIDDKEYYFIREDDIMAIIED